MQQKENENLKAGEEFLAENAKKRKRGEFAKRFTI